MAQINSADLLNGLPADLTLIYFLAFARLEYAMKFSGCLSNESDGALAMASREKLAARLPADFFAGATGSSVTVEIVQRPPKRLLVRQNNHPDFGSKQVPVGTTSELLDALWWVRNNLFHGNKTSSANRDRDEKLMRGSLHIIQAILDAEPGVAGQFFQPQQVY